MASVQLAAMEKTLVSDAKCIHAISVTSSVFSLFFELPIKSYEWRP